MWRKYLRYKKAYKFPADYLIIISGMQKKYINFLSERPLCQKFPMYTVTKHTKKSKKI